MRYIVIIELENNYSHIHNGYEDVRVNVVSKSRKKFILLYFLFLREHPYTQQSKITDLCVK